MWWALSPQVGIGLTVLPKLGGRGRALAPPPPSLPASMRLVYSKVCTYLRMYVTNMFIMTLRLKNTGTHFSIHIYALNKCVLQGAPLSDISFSILKRHILLHII
jgi:hypothetical protein